MNIGKLKFPKQRVGHYLFLISDWKISVNFKGAADARKVLPSNALADLEGGLQGFQPSLSNFKNKRE